MLISEDRYIWNLYLEGAAEDMISSNLEKMGATPEEINLFLRKDENGKSLYKPEDLSVLFKWVKEQNANTRELENDYKLYQKFFPNVKLNQFNNYIDWTEKIHAKRDEASYHSRNKDLKDIDISGEDKENVLADDEDVLILKGDDEHKCVRYGKGYTFCISRGGGGNMYGNYRLSKESTFYFIYFKKIPKTDEKHIMVLDRTTDGWEWTFGSNQTNVVDGGWDEIVKSFPVLAKYENLFVNKPLTDEERAYQQKLEIFVNNPTIDEFEEFSYKEKADVLKFGMLIPLDLFKSLDKYLRNEWITVGPKMSDDIYKLLTDKEKERFVIVRKQQLTQREPEDKFDVEICRNDEELYNKYIKPDKELSEKEEKEIQNLIVDGVCKEDIRIKSKYFFPNLDNLKQTSGTIYASSATSISLPQLQKSGEINADSATSISLPQLQTSKDINADSATSISLPQLQKSGTIYANRATSISLPQLKESGSIYAPSAPSATSISLPQLQKSGNINASRATSISLPQLQNSGTIYANRATSISLPQLQESGSISAYDATSISLPQLQKSGEINADSATSISLPQLQTSGDIYAYGATSISLPQLQESVTIYANRATSISLPQLKESGSIYANNAKKIVINKHLVHKLKAPKDVKIIEPSEHKEELNDSYVYNLMKSFLLQS